MMPHQVLRDDTKRIYEFILEYIKKHRLPPSQREIAEGCFMSRSNVQKHLDILDAYGLISREIGMARGIILPEQATDDEDD